MGTTECTVCCSETKCRKRDFSEQAWAALILWNEVDQTSIERPMCDSCYNELREVLIDRSDEIDKNQDEAPKPKKRRRAS